MREHGRLHVVAGLEPLGLSGTADLELGALADALLDELLDAAVLRGRHDRPDVAARLAGIADDDVLGRRGRDRRGLVHPGRGNEHAGRRVARLTRVRAHPGHVARDHGLEVGVVEDDVGRLAAELLRDALHRRRRGAGDLDAGAGRARERHHVDVGVGRERRADVDAVAVHEVEHAGGHAGRVHDLGEHDRVQRRDLGRLEHHRAARRDRRRDLAGDLVQRPVPGRDHSAHADGLTHDQRGAHRALELEVGEHAARGREVTESGGGLRGLRQPQRCADLLADDVGELLHAAGVHADDAVEQREALVLARQRERLERGLGRGDRGVDVVGAAHRDRLDRLLGGRVDHIERVARERRDPLAVDVELLDVIHDLLLEPPTVRGQARPPRRYVTKRAPAKAERS